MITKVFTAATFGLNAQEIEVEVDISPGLPAVIVVGLPDKAVQESKERIKSGLKQSGYEFPLGKITINLAPADIAKSGSSFDVSMAVGILKLTDYIKTELGTMSLFLGELSLDGRVRPITGVLTLCLWAKNHGYKRVFIPKQNEKEASLVKGINIFAVEKLEHLIRHLNAEELLAPVQAVDLGKLTEHFFIKSTESELLPNDMAYVRGQEVAKRAMEIAASGGHNVLFVGQPGSGKTLLARSYPTILPRMTEEEVLEVTQIYSVAGLLKDNSIIAHRPFRAPHHSASHIALVGGGAKLRPGEISLSHRGVLFLDEFPEFSRESVESLRQPLEDGFVNISRASGSVMYPSRFYLLAAANPTPSGYDIDDPDSMNRPQSRSAVARYQAKFSGPILDRIDLQVEVNRPKTEELQQKTTSENSMSIQQRVQAARDIQLARFKNENIYTNGEMILPMIEQYCALDPAGEKLLAQAVEKFRLSARSYMRLLKVARTIADLSKHENIHISDLAESLQYRGRWG